jgi:hypothetical protein
MLFILFISAVMAANFVGTSLRCSATLVPRTITAGRSCGQSFTELGSAAISVFFGQSPVSVFLPLIQGSVPDLCSRDCLSSVDEVIGTLQSERCVNDTINDIPATQAASMLVVASATGCIQTQDQFCLQRQINLVNTVLNKNADMQQAILQLATNAEFICDECARNQMDAVSRLRLDPSIQSNVTSILELQRNVCGGGGPTTNPNPGNRNGNTDRTVSNTPSTPTSNPDSPLPTIGAACQGAIVGRAAGISSSCGSDVTRIAPSILRGVSISSLLDSFSPEALNTLCSSSCSNSLTDLQSTLQQNCVNDIVIPSANRNGPQAGQDFLDAVSARCSGRTAPSATISASSPNETNSNGGSNPSGPLPTLSPACQAGIVPRASVITSSCGQAITDLGTPIAQGRSIDSLLSGLSSGSKSQLCSNQCNSALTGLFDTFRGECVNDVLVPIQNKLAPAVAREFQDSVQRICQGSQTDSSPSSPSPSSGPFNVDPTKIFASNSLKWSINYWLLMVMTL